MELYIGGYAQGKLSYVKQKKAGQQVEIFNEFHLWVKEGLQKGQDVEQMTDALLEKNPELIIICDEIGNGIVPMDPFEREYRERLGRILINLAKKAEVVEKITCGIGMRIK